MPGGMQQGPVEGVLMEANPRGERKKTRPKGGAKPRDPIPSQPAERPGR